MNNIIIETDIKATQFVPLSSRYAQSDVIYYGENKFITFKTYKREQKSQSREDKFYVITPGTEYRPDLVSQKAFNTVDYWWKIMEYNNIKDIFDFTKGKTIRIPSRTSF